MIQEENQNQENPTEENPVSAPPKQEVVEGVSSSAEATEDKPIFAEAIAEEKVVSPEQNENQTKEVETIENKPIPQQKKENYIKELRTFLLNNNENVSEVEMTKGNYDDGGDLIKDDVPTITTDFCEIGKYNSIVYFTFVIYSDSYNKNIFDSFQSFANVQFYPFFDFNKRLYPKDNFDYNIFEKEIIKEKYFQINFNYNAKNITPENLYQEYERIKNIFQNSGVEIVNQLQVDLTSSFAEVTEDKQIKTIENEISPQGRASSVASAPPRGTTFSRDFVFNLLIKARAKIQERKRKKLNKILSLFETKSQITNSNIQKLLRVSRATAKRYMDILEKENKVTQVGNTGKGVFYIKKP